MVIGRHTEIMYKIIQLLKSEGYIAKGFLTHTEAENSFKSENFDGVVIGGGVDSPTRNLIQSEFPKINPRAKIIDAHPSTLLADLDRAFK